MKLFAGPAHFNDIFCSVQCENSQIYLCYFWIQFCEVQTRSFGLKANRFKKNKGSNLYTRKSWVLPKTFRGVFHRRQKKLTWKRYLKNREVVLGEWGEDDVPLAVRTSSDARTEGTHDKRRQKSANV